MSMIGQIPERFPEILHSRLAFEPESINQLAGRYKAAIRDPFDILDVLGGKVSGPGAFRANVFDSHDGIRLMVAVEIHVGSSWVLRLSASPASEPSRRAVASGELDKEEFRWLALARFRAISRDERPLTFLGHAPHCDLPYWGRLLAGPPPEGIDWPEEKRTTGRAAGDQSRGPRNWVRRTCDRLLRACLTSRPADANRGPA